MSLEIDTNNTRIAWLTTEEQCQQQHMDDDEDLFGDTEASDTSNTSNISSTSSNSSSISNNSSSNINQSIVPYTPPSISLQNPVFGMDLDSCIVPINGCIHNFNNTGSSYDSNPDLDCPICLDLLTDSEIIRMDCCGKKIHLKCINEWYTKNRDMQMRSLCIMCRVESELMNDIYNTLQMELDTNSEEDSSHTSTDDNNDKCTCKKIIIIMAGGFIMMLIMILFFNVHLSTHHRRNLTDGDIDSMLIP